MLQQQTTETEVNVAQVRVTPRELAQATANVEARRDAEAKRLTDTIALGEAVQQLGLATTPEELFAEVQALRANAQNNTEAETKSVAADQTEMTAQFTWMAGVAVIAFSLLFGMIAPHVFIMGGTAYTPSIMAAQVLPSTPAAAPTVLPQEPRKFAQ